MADVYAAMLGRSTRTVLPTSPNPAYRYLKVTVQDRPPALLVLGYLEPHPLGEIEVWYSSDREVVKLQNGRLIGTVGLELDWRWVGYAAHTPPPWAQILLNPANSYTYERVRDVMPGYHMGQRERLQVRVGVPPAEVLKIGALPRAVWIQEAIFAPSQDQLPPAWFALSPINAPGGSTQVLASYQCLSAELCLHLQPWPVAVAP